MATVTEQIKENTMQQVEAVRGLRIYKTRTPGDDGWQFVAAKDANEARRKLGTRRAVVTATRDDLVTLAARALTGNF